jgi:hypothetical protein
MLPFYHLRLHQINSKRSRRPSRVKGVRALLVSPAEAVQDNMHAICMNEHPIGIELM